jgi:two-component sensor histidine kinase
MLPFIFFTRAPARLLAYALCLAILIPSLSFAAYLLSETHTRELGILHQSVQSRATLAASLFDQQMGRLLKTLKELPRTPAAATQNVYDSLRSELDRDGILILTRNASLELLSPASGVDAALVSLDSPARTAAAAAVAKLTPQITPYGMADNGGVNIWIATTEKDAAPTLLQAHIPSSYLAAAFKNFVSDGPWSISVVGRGGRTYAEAGGAPAGSNAPVLSKASFIEGFADTSQFGWKIAAGVPSRSIEQRARRNWMTFLAISSLLAVTSFAGATLLTRSLLEETSHTNLPPAPGMPPLIDRPANTQRFLPDEGMSQDRMRAALRGGNVGVWEWNLQTGRATWDAEIAGIFGRTQNDGDESARDVLRDVDPRDRRRLMQALKIAIRKSKRLAVEVRVRRPDGQTRWIALRGASTSAQDNGPSGLSGVGYDVTEQKISLKRTDALLREVSHRSKNLLALILAMARLTARDAVDVKSHLKDFTLRVAGLAASQDLIVASDWHSVDLAALASAEIGAVARTDADRIAVSGPKVLLTPEAAQTLGMVLTELALNAVEHGALSAAKGQVTLSWTFPDQITIAIAWHETGGPPSILEGPKGYGRSVVERFSTQGLKLAVHSETGDNGFNWTLTGPLDHIGTRSA